MMCALGRSGTVRSCTRISAAAWNPSFRGMLMSSKTAGQQEPEKIGEPLYSPTT